MRRLATRAYFLLIRIDCQLNGLTGGNPQETISCRVGRASAAGCKIAWVVDCILDEMFFWEKDHCGQSLRRHEEKRKST